MADPAMSLSRAPQRAFPSSDLTQLIIQRHRGLAMIYVMVCLLAVFGLVSLAVDVGRLRASKAQLSTAADAASFAGASALPAGDTNAARSAAIDVSAANHCTGVPVSLQTSDVEFGLYRVSTGTYTPAGSAEPGGHVVRLQECNAVKCTPRRTTARGNPVSLYFAQILGQPTIDVVATATAFVRGGPRAGGIIGLEWVSMNGNTHVDSYSEEPYDPSNFNSNGTVMSNGTISMNGTPDIYGDARPGVDHWVNMVGVAQVHGWIAPLDEPLVFPPAEVPAGTSNSGQLRLRGGETRTLSPGTYWFTSIDMKGNSTLIIQPSVKIYVTGVIDISGGSISNPGTPSDLELFQVGGAMVDLGGGSVLKAHVYAPQSDVRYHGTNSGGMYGWVVGNTLDIKGNSQIHYDETMPGGNLPFRTVLVR